MMPKPARWAVNPGMVAPSWRWAWRGLVGVVPFWPEGNTWPKHDIPLGSDISELSDPENLGALPTYTLTRLGPAMRTPFDDTVYRGPYFASSEPINVRWRTTSYWTMAVFHQYRAIDSLSVLCGTTPATVTTAYNGLQRNSAQPSNTVQGYVYVSSANYTTSNVTLTANDFNFTVARYDGSEVWAANYVNGQQTSLATPTSIAGVADHSGSGQRFAFGCGSLNTRQTDTDFLVVYIWDRALGDDEIGVLARDPFGPIRPAGTLIVPIAVEEASVTILYATADGTVASVVNELDTTTNLYTSVDDDPGSPNDSDWINNTGSTGSQFLLLTDMPADFATADSGTIKVRYRGQSFGSGTVTLYAQLYQSNETTTMSDEVQVAQVTGNGSFANTADVTFTGLDTGSGKSTWDGARIKFRWATT